MKPLAPCKDCKDRVITPPCHTTCEKYLAFREKLAEYHEAREKERHERSIVDNYIIARSIKYRRK